MSCVCGQAMLILAFSGPSGLQTLIKVLSIFPAAACYQFIEGEPRTWRTTGLFHPASARAAPGIVFICNLVHARLHGSRSLPGGFK